MSKHAISPFTSISSEPINKCVNYPYLVVRLMSAVYQREHIDVRRGEPLGVIQPGKSYVQHPEPITDDGIITPGCRTLLLNAVKESVKRTKFRMSVIWGKGEVSYVELDGSINESSSIPSGGIVLPNKIAFDQRIDADSKDRVNTNGMLH